MPSLVAAAITGYLLGSIPFAYLIVRWNAKLDIRNEGSGNVGTLNSYEVTGSRFVGSTVFALDLLKGVASVLLGSVMTGGAFCGAAAAGCAAVAGHNFPLWLRFRGGRGLAPALGVMGVLGWPVLPAWFALWGVSFLGIREVNVANAVATGTVFILFIAAPGGIIAPLLPAGSETADFRLFGSVLCGLVVLKLIKPVSVYLRNRRERPRQ